MTGNELNSAIGETIAQGRGLHQQQPQRKWEERERIGFKK